jgi:hypothetical protein
MTVSGPNAFRAAAELVEGRVAAAAVAGAALL